MCALMDSSGNRTAPSFDELPALPGSSERHAWDVWGRDDELGSVNFIDAAKVRAAGALIQSGRVISLNLPLNEPSPGLFAGRSAPSHHIAEVGHGRDDYLDGFFLQFSSQWDGLRHVRFRQHGFWGGRQDSDIDERGEIGIERWSRHGIITRGVLIDAYRFFALHELPVEQDENFRITPDMLDEMLADQSVTVGEGDVVILRTGWLEWYRDLQPEQRQALVGTVGRQPHPLACPGLHAGPDTAAWLWNRRVAAVAADNPTLEALPVDREIGFLHYRLLPLLGMPIGEYWALTELAEHCAQTGRYEFMLSSGVLDLPGGVGSPSNAYAIF